MFVGILGGTRHIGPPMVRMLMEAGHRVAVFNRGVTPVVLPDGVEHVKVDRKVEGQLAVALRAHPPDVIFDCIAMHTADVEPVFEALPELQHYVWCGSTAVYGRIGWTTPDESIPLDADSPYTTGKGDCEELLKRLYEEKGWPVTMMRLAHPYGPGDHLLYVSGREAHFLDRMRKGRPILIPGDGTTRMHPIYVDDVARGFIHVMGNPECMGRIFNLAGEEIPILNEYFESIARVLGVPLVAERIPHEFFHDHADLWSGWNRGFGFGYNFARYQSAFDTGALRDTGFRCHTNHDAGVELTMEWLEEGNLIPTSSKDDEEDRVLKYLAQGIA
jgi:nucleoside-diphosphate-sugar epimerase